MAYTTFSEVQSYLGMSTTGDATLINSLVDRAQSAIDIYTGRTFEHTLGELLHGTRSHFMDEWLSEAVSFHRAVVPHGFRIDETVIDTASERETDYYYLRVRQKNNQKSSR